MLKLLAPVLWRLGLLGGVLTPTISQLAYVALPMEEIMRGF
jgi:hypothetical protein